eukprot:COSAG01_NODE_500_length_16223_cov_42.586988_7_plen_118_part_00
MITAFFKPSNPHSIRLEPISAATMTDLGQRIRHAPNLPARPVEDVAAMQRELNTTLIDADFDMIDQSAFSVRGVERSGRMVAHTSWPLGGNDTMIDVEDIHLSLGAAELDDYPCAPV